MEGSERVRAALAMEPLDGRDHPPAGWWGHTYAAEWSPASLARVTLERQRRFGWDFVKLQPRATCFAEAFGATYRPSGRPDRAPVPQHQPVSGPEDWEAVVAAAPDAGGPALADQTDALSQVVGELDGSVPVIQTVFSPLTVAGYLLGEDRGRAVGELRARPEVVGAALARIGETLADFASRSVEAGAAGVFYAVSGYASADLMTEEEYRELALPHDRRVLDAVPSGAWFNVLHLCGGNLHFGLAGDLPSHAVSWSVHDPGNPSLAEGRDLARRAAMGGVDRVGALLNGSPGLVRAQVRQAIEQTAGRGLLLAPGCSVPPEAPEETLAALTHGAARPGG
jgi:uroporphyrinogen decarboxylase